MNLILAGSMERYVTAHIVAIAVVPLFVAVMLADMSRIGTLKYRVVKPFGGVRSTMIILIGMHVFDDERLASLGVCPFTLGNVRAVGQFKAVNFYGKCP